MALSKIQAESMNLADTFAFTGTVTGAGEAPEEGTWTPVMSSLSHTLQIGRYIKIGKMITVQATIHGTSTRSGGSVQVSGLPYATNSTANFYQSAALGGYSHVGFTSASMLGLTVRFDPNNTIFQLMRYRHNNNFDGLQATQQGTNAQIFYLGGTYIAN
tara:strand:- start:678 stop:1154 length:477 start_codon:yes stop_codon:yes gene_type:complete